MLTIHLIGVRSFEDSFPIYLKLETVKLRNFLPVLQVIIYFPTYHLIHYISRKTLSTVCVWKHKSDLLTKNLNRAQALKHTATLGLEDVHQVDLFAVLLGS